MAKKSANDRADRAIAPRNVAEAASTQTRAAKPRTAPRDLALLAGPTADGKGQHMLRLKDGALHAGELRPAPEGKPMGTGELVKLKPVHPDSPICEVETIYGADPGSEADIESEGRKQASPSTAKRRAAGPARVSTDSYRKNWNAIFGAGTRKRSHDWSVN